LLPGKTSAARDLGLSMRGLRSAGVLGDPVLETGETATTRAVTAVAPETETTAIGSVGVITETIEGATESIGVMTEAGIAATVAAIGTDTTEADTRMNIEAIDIIARTTEGSLMTEEATPELRAVDPRMRRLTLGDRHQRKGGP
jgi:hypothetical protein